MGSVARAFLYSIVVFLAVFAGVFAATLAALTHKIGTFRSNPDMRALKKLASSNNFTLTNLAGRPAAGLLTPYIETTIGNGTWLTGLSLTGNYENVDFVAYELYRSKWFGHRPYTLIIFNEASAPGLQIEGGLFKPKISGLDIPSSDLVATYLSEVTQWSWKEHNNKLAGYREGHINSWDFILAVHAAGNISKVVL